MIGVAGGRVELRHHRGEAQRPGVARVDARDERVDEPLEHLVAEPPRDGLGDGHVLVQRGGRRGQILTGPGDAGRGHEAAGLQRVEVGRHPHELRRHRTQRATAPHVRLARGGVHELAVDADLPAQVERPRDTEEEGVGAVVDEPAGERGGAQLAADPFVALDQGHGAAPGGHLVSGGQAGDAAADHDDVAHATREHPIGERADDDGIVVEHTGAGEGQIRRLGHLLRLDVEVVEHLEVVGHEPLRAHAHRRRPGRCPPSSRMTSSTSGPRHGSGVAPALCHAMLQPAPRASPAAAATCVALARSWSGYGSPARTRSGRLWAVKRTSWASGSVARRLGDGTGQEVDVLGEQVPAPDGHRDRAPGLGRLGQPALVLTHARARVVGREHEPDDRAHAPTDQLGRRVLDER